MIERILSLFTFCFHFPQTEDVNSEMKKKQSNIEASSFSFDKELTTELAGIGFYYIAICLINVSLYSLPGVLLSFKFFSNTFEQNLAKCSEN